MVGEIESRFSPAKIESFIIRLELLDLKGFLWSDTLRRVLLPPLQIKAFESVNYNQRGILCKGIRTIILSFKYFQNIASKKVLVYYLQR